MTQQKALLLSLLTLVMATTKLPVQYKVKTQQRPKNRYELVRAMITFVREYNGVARGGGGGRGRLPPGATQRECQNPAAK